MPKHIVKSKAPLPTIAPNPNPIISFLKEEHERRFVVNSGIEIPNATSTPVPVSENSYFPEMFSSVALYYRSKFVYALGMY